MKLYEKIKSLLNDSPELKDSDMKLFWRIWTSQGLTSFGQISEDQFMHEAIHPETIRRTRQKVQAEHPELQSSESVKLAKKAIEDTKGTFVYREEFTGKLF